MLAGSLTKVGWNKGETFAEGCKGRWVGDRLDLVEEAGRCFTLSPNSSITNNVDDVSNEAILQEEAHVSVAMGDKTPENVIHLLPFALTAICCSALAFDVNRILTML